MEKQASKTPKAEKAAKAEKAPKAAKAATAKAASIDSESKSKALAKGKVKALTVPRGGLAFHGDITETSYTPKKNITWDEWREDMHTMEYVEGASQWWIGDGLNSGEGLFKEEYAQISAELHLEPQTLSMLKWVAGRIPQSARIASLSVAHHRVIAGLEVPLAEKKALLKAASEDTRDDGRPQPLSVLRDRIANLKAIKHEEAPRGELNVTSQPEVFALAKTVKAAQEEKKRKAREEKREHRGPRESKPLYPVVYADPPEGRKVEQLCAERVEDAASPDAVLFMWAMPDTLQVSLAVMEAWGFAYRDHIIWDREMPEELPGVYTRNQHELLLIGRRGNPPDPEITPDSVLVEHSPDGARPGAVFEMIEQMYPEFERLDVFPNGSAPRQGWVEPLRQAAE